MVDKKRQIVCNDQKLYLLIINEQMIYCINNCFQQAHNKVDLLVHKANEQMAWVNYQWLLEQKQQGWWPKYINNI